MNDAPNRTRKRQKRKPGVFTDKYIQSLKAETQMYQIREARGFAIRVLPSSVKSWYYIYTFGGKRRQMCLGNYSDVSLEKAHDEYRKAFELVKSGIDPLNVDNEQKTVTAESAIHTVTKLKSLYIEHVKSTLVPLSIVQISRTLEQDVLPIIGDFLVTDIRRKDAIALVEQIAIRAPGQARNVIKAARAMFSYALDREMVDGNPFSRVGRSVPSTAPKSRTRTLSDFEIKHIWENLKKSEVGRAILLVLVTAQRPGEVSGTLWNEIAIGVGEPRCNDCRRCGWWMIPAERTKNKDGDHRVYLTDLAFSLLPDKLAEHVYPAIGRGRAIGATGGMRPGTLSQYITDNEYFGLSRWTPHDLRRTARTFMSALEVPERHAEAVLNHNQTGVKKVYDLYKYDKQKAAALIKWAEFLKKLL